MATSSGVQPYAVVWLMSAPAASSVFTVSSELARVANTSAVSPPPVSSCRLRGVVVDGCGRPSCRRRLVLILRRRRRGREAVPAAAPSARAARPLQRVAPAAAAAAPGSIAWVDRFAGRPLRGLGAGFERAFRSAPRSISSLTAAGMSLIGRPHQRRRPSQRFLRVDLSAPRSSSTFIAATLPVRDAIISAVSPRGSCSFGSAPAFSRLSMMAAFPFRPASESGVKPSRLATLGLAPA